MRTGHDALAQEHFLGEFRRSPVAGHPRHRADPDEFPDGPGLRNRQALPGGTVRLPRPGLRRAGGRLALDRPGAAGDQDRRRLPDDFSGAGRDFNAAFRKSGGGRVRWLLPARGIARLGQLRRLLLRRAGLDLRSRHGAAGSPGRSDAARQRDTCGLRNPAEPGTGFFLRREPGPDSPEWHPGQPDISRRLPGAASAVDNGARLAGTPRTGALVLAGRGRLAARHPATDAKPRPAAGLPARDSPAGVTGGGLLSSAEGLRRHRLAAGDDDRDPGPDQHPAGGPALGAGRSRTQPPRL